MTKEELATQYAGQKAEDLATLVQEAYLKGYEQGCLDTSNTVTIDDVAYVDMGLPSGTLWSKTPLEYSNYGYKQRLLSYSEAIQLPIPSTEQWTEILDYCQFFNFNIIGPSGERISYGWAPSGYLIRNLGEGCDEMRNMFWLKGEVDSNNKAPTMIYDVKRIDDIEWRFRNYKGSSRHFIGYRLPVFLVRNKE